MPRKHSKTVGEAPIHHTIKKVPPLAGNEIYLLFNYLFKMKGENFAC